MMFQKKPQHSYIDLFEGILIGGSLVAMSTFLFGTKKGKRLQKDLLHQYHKLKHKADHLREKLEKTVHKNAPKVKRAAKMIRAEARRIARKAAKVKHAAKRKRVKTRRTVRKAARKAKRRHS